MADRYDRLYRAYLRHTHQKMMEKLSLTKDDKILDVSAGTGMLAERILSKYGPFKRLVLNDPSKGMLEQAKYLLRNHKEVEFTSDFSENLSFKEDDFTKIISLNSLQYYTDHPAVLSHFRRMLESGGDLYILSWNRTGIFRILNRIISVVSKQEINTLTLDEMQVLLKEAGFTIQDSESWRFRWWKLFFVKCG